MTILLQICLLSLLLLLVVVVATEAKLPAMMLADDKQRQWRARAVYGIIHCSIRM